MSDMCVTRITVEIDIEHDSNFSLENTKEEILQSVLGRKLVEDALIIKEEPLDR